MDYSDDYVREYLPRQDPPPEAVPVDAQDEIIRRLDFMGGPEGLTARATRWTYAIFAELEARRVRFDEPRNPSWIWDFRPVFGLGGTVIDRVSFGLFDREHERDGLGLIVDVPPFPGPNVLDLGYVTFPYLANARFPIALRQSELELHLDHPMHGTSACFAQCKRDQNLWGVLTSGHVVGSRRRGRAVPFASGGSGSLVRSGYQPVDAAFVEVAAKPATPTPLPVLSFPAVSMSATVHCRTGSMSRTIVEVTSNCGVVHTRSIGMLIYLDNPEQPGDSGALVTVAGGEAVGIYKGGLHVGGPSGGARGMAQNFEQAIYTLGVTPYR